MANLEITMVAARRPALLDRTLQSFHDRLFRHFDIAAVFANIDPIWGDESDATQCAAILRNRFPNAVIFTPETPNFCSAVKRVWSATKGEFIFHLEDDWEITENIDSSILDRFNDPFISQVSLVSQTKNWDRARRGDFHYTRRPIRLFHTLQLPIRKKVPAFTTGPAFSRGDFARGWAALMNEKLDPEKQTYRGVNGPLEKFVAPFRNYLYPGKVREVTIVDIGREWRAARQIEKRIVNGKSTWTTDRSRPLPAFFPAEQKFEQSPPIPE